MEKLLEEWRPVKGFEGQYEVSNLGNVRKKDGKLIKSTVYEREYGYKQVVCNLGLKHFTVSRIVAQSFPEICGEWFYGCHVHHKDYDSTNNVATNLIVCTIKEHGAFHGGEHHPQYGTKFSKETCLKISKANKGRKMSDETRKKMSESHKGEKNHLYGKHFKQSEETCRRKSEAHKGEKNYWYGKSLPRHVIEKSIKKNSKPINQYTLDGQFIKEWSSAMEIKRQLGYCNTTIGRVCQGLYKQAHGYRWAYAS